MRRPALIGLVLALVAVFWPWKVGAQDQSPLRLLGQFSFESRRMFQDTMVGGLSGLAYDANRGVYYAVSDSGREVTNATAIFRVILPSVAPETGRIFRHKTEFSP